MLLSAVRQWFRRPPLAHPAEAPRDHVAGLLETAASPSPEVGPKTNWPAARLDLTNQLWGPGFIFPGGEIETLRLARPLGVSAASSLLLVGVGGGGPASSLARNLGVWVTGMDHEPPLLAAAKTLIQRSQLTKKVTIKSWDPDAPAFDAKSHHHCLALEPLHGAQPEPILDGLARALKQGGQLVLTELTANEPLNLKDPVVSRWAMLEKRDAANVLPTVAIGRMLGRVGMDVRIAEDISDRHIENALLGWRVMLRDMGDYTPNRHEAAHLVSEAELWLLRRRLIRDGRLRMMRWHAISRSRDQAGLPPM